MKIILVSDADAWRTNGATNDQLYHEQLAAVVVRIDPCFREGAGIAAAGTAWRAENLIRAGLKSRRYCGILGAYPLLGKRGRL